MSAFRNPAHRARRYRAFFVLALRQGRAEAAALLGRVLFFVLILMVFSRLWQLVLQRGALGDVGPTECTWYLAITEWILLSVPALHLDIERDVRSGDVALQLVRPLSYVSAQLAAGLGHLIVRLLLLAPAGLAAALIFGAGLPADARGLVLVVPMAALAATLLMIFHAIIGLCAFWLQDVSPLYWIYQKLAFVLGGLLLPLEIYPSWLRTICDLSPFSSAIYGSGRLALGYEPLAAGANLARLLVFIASSVAVLYVLQHRAYRRLEINGG